MGGRARPITRVGSYALGLPDPMITDVPRCFGLHTPLAILFLDPFPLSVLECFLFLYRMSNRNLTHLAPLRFV